MELVPQIESLANEFTQWRRDIHAHPELGFEEARTADFVAEKLESFGIQVQRGVGKTGVVGVLRCGNEPRSIGLRADMDALPIHENNDFGHRSTHDGTMHACGHDGHTVMLLAAAKYLAESRDFRGQVNFIFQPAEEGGAGAAKMIDEGLFADHQMETVWGMHNWPGLPAGEIAVSEGASMASADHFEMTVTGRGGHAAMPHQAIDPVLAAAHIVQALQILVSRHTNPQDSSVLSITTIHGGSAFNVIPDEVILLSLIHI